MSDETIILPATSDNSLASSLTHIRFRTTIKFDCQCLKQDKVTFSHKTAVKIYEFKLTKNADFDNYKCSAYGIGFDACGSLLLSDASRFHKNVIIFGTDMSSSGHVDNREKDVLIVGHGPVQRSDDTASNAEKAYAVNFSEQQKKFCLSLYYKGANSYIFVSSVEMYKFKAKGSEINAALLCFA